MISSFSASLARKECPQILLLVIIPLASDPSRLPVNPVQVPGHVGTQYSDIQRLDVSIHWGARWFLDRVGGWIDGTFGIGSDGRGGNTRDFLLYRRSVSLPPIVQMG